MNPIVAIIGRPNVGKSTLFNRLIGKRLALVDDTPGVTRDRQYGTASWLEHNFIVIDTGGLVPSSSHKLDFCIKKQTSLAVEEADVVICLFDGRSEMGHADRSIVELVRKAGKPVVYAVNKMEAGTPGSYFELGNVFPISAEHGRMIDDLLDEVVKYFPKGVEKEEIVSTSALRIAVIGRPNVGKSSLINAFAGQERVIAHEMPGTTRDAIDVEITFRGSKFIFVDTAGLKRKGRTLVAIDKFTAIKSLRAIERADIVLIMIDVIEGVTHQDTSLIGYVYSEGKGLMVLSNKWDTVERADINKYEKFFAEKFSVLHRVPFLNISVKTGQNLNKIIPEVIRISNSIRTKITTSELNKMLEGIVEGHNLPAWRGHTVKLFYATQVKTSPPVFAIFTNYPEGIVESYKRYLINRFQDFIGNGVPIKIVFKKRK